MSNQEGRPNSYQRTRGRFTLPGDYYLPLCEILAAAEDTRLARDTPVRKNTPPHHPGVNRGLSEQLLCAPTTYSCVSYQTSLTSHECCGVLLQIQTSLSEWIATLPDKQDHTVPHCKTGLLRLCPRLCNVLLSK